MLKALKPYWVGLLCTTAFSAAVLWLWLNDLLIWYLSPSYVWFAVTMAILALATVVAVCTAAALFAERPELLIVHDHDHGDDEEPRLRTLEGDSGELFAEQRARYPRGILGLRKFGSAVFGVAVTALMVVSTLVFPPATISQASASDRGVNAAFSALNRQSVDMAGDHSDFDIADWAVVLQLSRDPDYFLGKSTEQLGFVSADPSGNPDRFFLTRFLITHCAIDALPMGIPVAYEGWQQAFGEGDWVEINGTFGINAFGDGLPAVLTVDRATKTEPPLQPYVY